METRSDGLFAMGKLCRCARGEGLTARHGHMETSKIYHASPNPPRTRRRWKDPPTVTSWLASPSSFEGQQAHAHTLPVPDRFHSFSSSCAYCQDKTNNHAIPNRVTPTPLADGKARRGKRRASSGRWMAWRPQPPPTSLGPAQPLRLSLPASHFNVTVHFLHVCLSVCPTVCDPPCLCYAITSRGRGAEGLVGAAHLSLRSH
jgi:hypothetical protein